ncbi:MAG TPA: alpha/beta hydrolase [Anaerolineae bacterium]|nr:alpha/beta hydrolase [Anaerolineae bacterium]
MAVDSTRSSKKRGCFKWLGVALCALALLLIALLTLTWFQGSRAKAALRAKYPPPGQMVDVGGYQLHIYCLGSGSPTVVLEAGAGDFSLTWELVQPEVAQTTRICAYDRAGLGWSQRGPEPLTVENTVEELHTLLTNGGIEGPYVLVGHSLGGAYVRAYAFRYPEEVVGMVLVDASHEDQEARFPAAFAKVSQQGRAQMAQLLGLVQAANSLGIMAMSPQSYPDAYLPPMPEATREVYKGVVLSHGSFFAAVAEQHAHAEDNLAEIREMNITTLGDIPLVVLSSAKLELPEGYGLTAEDMAELQAVQSQMHAELAALSPQGEVVIAEESTHYIQFDQPELVIDAIRQVLDAQ